MRFYSSVSVLYLLLNNNILLVKTNRVNQLNWPDTRTNTHKSQNILQIVYLQCVYAHPSLVFQQKCWQGLTSPRRDPPTTPHDKDTRLQSCPTRSLKTSWPVSGYSCPQGGTKLTGRAAGDTGQLRGLFLPGLFDERREWEYSLFSSVVAFPLSVCWVSSYKHRYT